MRSRRSPAPAVILLEAAERHCRSSADLQAGPRPPTLSLVFFKCPCTLPLSTTSMWTSDSDKHFLEPSRRELKESLKVTLKTPGSIPRPPIPFPSVPTAWPGFPSPSGRRLTPLELAYLQVFHSPREDTGLHLRPIFSTSPEKRSGNTGPTFLPGHKWLEPSNGRSVGPRPPCFPSSHT